MSSQIRIQLDQTSYTPGGTVAGKAGWELDKEPRSASVRLFWITSGKGTKDVMIVDEVDVPNPVAAQLFEFSFQLPVEPYSFHGKLISITWGVEVIVDKQNDMMELVMAPGGVVCDLAQLSKMKTTISIA